MDCLIKTFERALELSDRVPTEEVKHYGVGHHLEHLDAQADGDVHSAEMTLDAEDHFGTNWMLDARLQGTPYRSAVGDKDKCPGAEQDRDRPAVLLSHDSDGQRDKTDLLGEAVAGDLLAPVRLETSEQRIHLIKEDPGAISVGGQWVADQQEI